MILTEFPDLNWLKKQAEESFSNRKAAGGQMLPSSGWPTVILNTEAVSICRDNIRGPLSIFTNISGESAVETGNRKVKIKEGFFYVTNHDQYYTLEVDKTKTLTFNIHFGEYFADQIFNSLSNHPGKLLEDEFIAPPERIEFYNKLYTKRAPVSNLISQVYTVRNEGMWLDEKLYQLMLLLLEENKAIKKMRDDLPVLKSSTREEIIKRLLHSIDYMYIHCDKSLSLDELASVSCLSKFHFLRLFKIAFNKTPHQYLTEVKLEKAKVLLKRTKREVKHIAGDLGFENASSFSRMFYNHVGAYPAQYR